MSQFQKYLKTAKVVHGTNKGISFRKIFVVLSFILLSNTAKEWEILRHRQLQTEYIL